MEGRNTNGQMGKWGSGCSTCTTYWILCTIVCTHKHSCATAQSLVCNSSFLCGVVLRTSGLCPSSFPLGNKRRKNQERVLRVNNSNRNVNIPIIFSINRPPKETFFKQRPKCLASLYCILLLDLSSEVQVDLYPGKPLCRVVVSGPVGLNEG